MGSPLSVFGKVNQGSWVCYRIASAQRNGVIELPALVVASKGQVTEQGKCEGGLDLAIFTRGPADFASNHPGGKEQNIFYRHNVQAGTYEELKDNTWVATNRTHLAERVDRIVAMFETIGPLFDQHAEALEHLTGAGGIGGLFAKMIEGQAGEAPEGSDVTPAPGLSENAQNLLAGCVALLVGRACAVFDWVGVGYAATRREVETFYSNVLKHGPQDDWQGATARMLADLDNHPDVVRQGYVEAGILLPGSKVPGLPEEKPPVSPSEGVGVVVAPSGRASAFVAPEGTQASEHDVPSAYSATLEPMKEPDEGIPCPKCHSARTYCVAGAGDLHLCYVNDCRASFTSKESEDAERARESDPGEASLEETEKPQGD